jgi:uncharacterized protein YciI
MESSEPEWLTRYVVLYESPPEARARAPEFFAAHSAYADEFRGRYPGDLLMIGPFAEAEDGQPGAMSIFTSPERAEEFATSDPFVLNHVVAAWRVRVWLVSPDQ